jgi:hypothetical protein
LAIIPAPNQEQKHLNSKAKKAASSRASKTKVQEEEKIKKTTENNTNKAEEHKQTGKEVKAEEKTTIPKVKHKSNQLQLCKENFKNLRTFLGMYMLESVKVFMHWGSRMIRILGHLPVMPWETSATPKAPSFLQL